MINIDKNKCIGCGLCAKDCFARDIEVTDKKATCRNITCFKCGHCIAICPTKAVSTDEYNMDDVVEYNKDNFTIESDTLLNFIKFRRTIRQYKNQDVENEKLLKIIEAGRFTQTGSNSQNVSYVVVKDNISELRALTLESLNSMGNYILSNLNDENKIYKRYAQMWVDMYNSYVDNPNGQDNLFFNAPAVILVVSKSPINGALASSNMELMTNALGLGTLFSGFFVRAAQGNKKIMDLVGLEENQQIVTCMLIGYPSVVYRRTAPRKEAKISWM